MRQRLFVILVDHAVGGVHLLHVVVVALDEGRGCQGAVLVQVGVKGEAVVIVTLKIKEALTKYKNGC